MHRMPLAFAATLAGSLALIPATLRAEVPRVVSDIAVIQALAETVLGGLGQADVLLPPGADAHSYQLRPSQGAALQRADLVFWVGDALTPWLGRTLAGAALKGKSVPLLDAPETYLRDFGAGEAHDHEASATEPATGHDHAGTDPHAWLDPANAQAWLGLIAAELAAADPANAATYTANAEAGRARIAALDAAMSAALAPLAGRPFVVFHDAYGYFTDHYGLAVAGALNRSDASAPGAAHLTELRADLAAGGIICAFPEASHDPKMLAQLLEGTPVRTGGALDPTGSTLPRGAGLYEALLRDLAAKLTDCLAPR
ncbi:MAG: zinc ABC transporter substrate-binding protein [Alphaproteobacteria bacterium HGW-Alphaproteobacteria-4]|jgi:zinc transport system substrate-binding protein|nr:MAG: zinc ABC transporter substrate-binding protein [Alphaproteobacteria bacterium HGW-Alphaproteobacteria-4]